MMMMMMKRRRKFLLLEKGSSHLLRSHIKVKEDPLLKRIRLRKPILKRRNQSPRLQKPH
jgi:hypothetical protein